MESPEEKTAPEEKTIPRKKIATRVRTSLSQFSLAPSPKPIPRATRETGSDLTLSKEGLSDPPSTTSSTALPLPDRAVPSAPTPPQSTVHQRVSDAEPYCYDDSSPPSSSHMPRNTSTKSAPANRASKSASPKSKPPKAQRDRKRSLLGRSNRSKNVNQKQENKWLKERLRELEAVESENASLRIQLADVRKELRASEQGSGSPSNSLDGSVPDSLPNPHQLVESQKVEIEALTARVDILEADIKIRQQSEDMALNEVNSMLTLLDCPLSSSSMPSPTAELETVPLDPIPTPKEKSSNHSEEKRSFSKPRISFPLIKSSAVPLSVEPVKPYDPMPKSNKRSFIQRGMGFGKRYEAISSH